MFAPRVTVTDSRFVVLSLCLVSSLPWGPPSPQAEFQCSQQKGPPGAPSGMGVEQHVSATLLHHRSLPGALLGSVLRHSQNPGIRAGCPFPPRPIYLDPRGLGIPGNRARGRYPWLQEAWAALEAPAHSLPLPMEKLAGGHGIPSLPYSGGRSRALWEL